MPGVPVLQLLQKSNSTLQHLGDSYPWLPHVISKQFQQQTRMPTLLQLLRKLGPNWSHRINQLIPKASAKWRQSSLTLSLLKVHPETTDCSSAFPVVRCQRLASPWHRKRSLSRPPPSTAQHIYFSSYFKWTYLFSRLGSATTWRLSRELPSFMCRNKTSFWDRTERTQP